MVMPNISSSGRSGAVPRYMRAVSKGGKAEGKIISIAVAVGLGNVDEDDVGEQVTSDG